VLTRLAAASPSGGRQTPLVRVQTVERGQGHTVYAVTRTGCRPTSP